MTRTALATLVALGLSATAMAQRAAQRTHEPPGDDRTNIVTFAEADKDSKVDRDEAEDIDGFNFKKADADDSRWISRAEFQTAMAGSRPRG